MKGGIVIAFIGFVITAVLFTILGATPLLAAPITFNTALPIAEGEGVFRVQARFISSTEDPGPQGRELTVGAFPFVLAYGVTEKLALFGIVPVLDKEMEIKSMGVTRDTNGLGDITLLARYTAWKRDRPGETFRIAPFVGIEAPTGEDTEKDSLGPLPQPLQLGSGSWDYTIGAVLTWQTIKRQIDASASYKINTEANDFEFGDETRLEVSWQQRVWPKTLGSGVPAFIYAVLESNLIHNQKNREGGIVSQDSGGTAWFLAPGIQYVTRRTVLEAAVQLPVVQDLNGNALENDFTGILSFRINF